jgi:hypothetical protein
MQMNPLEARLEGIHRMLTGHQAGGNGLSSASKGTERAAFIEQFLFQILPPTFRFGQGDVIDSEGNQSGQLDVVAEYPFSPSLQVLHGSSRLYLSEGVAAVIEVKSNVAGQWDEAIGTANKLANVKRALSPDAFHLLQHGGPEQSIPLYVVGYTGWKTIDKVREHVHNSNISGILVIDSLLFVRKRRPGAQQPDGVIEHTGVWALWALIDSLYKDLTSLPLGGAHLMAYADGRCS